MGDTAVIVGAAHGIGRAVTHHLAKDPTISDLVIADIDWTALNSTRMEVDQSMSIRAFHVDVTDAASIARLIEESIEATRVAIVAGKGGSSPVLETGADEFINLYRVNTIGAYLVAQGYARLMIARGEGTICAVTSIAARVPRQNQAAYCASKAALRQALRVLALDTAPRGVRINMVSPGATNTALLRNLLSEADYARVMQGQPDGFRAKRPLPRGAEPEDIAAAIAFLLSAESKHIALHDLYVDGGESLGL